MSKLRDLADKFYLKQIKSVRTKPDYKYNENTFAIDVNWHDKLDLLVEGLCIGIRVKQNGSVCPNADYTVNRWVRKSDVPVLLILFSPFQKPIYASILSAQILQSTERPSQ